MDWNTSPYYMQNKHDVSAYIEPTTEHNIPPLLGSSCIEIDSTHPRVSFSYGLKKKKEKRRDELKKSYDFDTHQLVTVKELICWLMLFSF